MGSKGSQTVTQSGTQSQNYSPNQPILGAGNQAVTGAQAAAQLPFQMPQAPVAGFNPFQIQGFNAIQNLQGFAQPYFNTAGAYLAGSAAPITGSDVANYYNPMAQNVTAQMQNIFGQQNVQNTGNLVQSAGGVGADRVAVGQANMANQQGLAAGQTYAGLYQQALAAAEQNKQMQAGAGYAFGQMGPAAQAAQFNAVNQLLGAGGQQQQLAQAQANAAYQQQLAQIAFPYQQPQYLAGITAGLAPAMGGTTNGQYQNQTTYPSPTPLAQALGVGTAALGMFGGIPGMGSAGTALMGGAPWSAASQYLPLPGATAFGATPQYVNGGYYPMFARGGRTFDDGGGVDGDTYGKLADRGYYEAEAPMLAAAGRGNPMAETLQKDMGGVYNFEDGGTARVIPVGDVINIDPYMTDPNMTLRQALERSANRRSQGAQGFAGAPEEAVERAQNAGVLKIHPMHGFDDGGNVDQPQPMQLNLSPTSGFDAPGANPHVSGAGVIPKTQLPVGQSGRFGPAGIGYMYMPGAMPMGQHAPQQQNPMQAGQLGQMLGKGVGQLGNLLGGSGAAGTAGTAGDVASYASDIMDLTVARGGRAMADGGNIDDYPTIGPGAPMAPKPPQIPLPRPREGPPRQYHQWSPGHERDIASAGGAVGRPNRHWDYLQPMQPQAFVDGGEINPDIPDQGPSFGQMIGDTAQQAGMLAKRYWRGLTGQPEFDPAQPIQPESLDEDIHAHHPEMPAASPGPMGVEAHVQPEDAPLLPSEQEALGYGRPRSGRPEVMSGGDYGPPPQAGDFGGAPFRRTDRPEAQSGEQLYATPDRADPFGHGMEGAPRVQGIATAPQQFDMSPFRRATIAQENAKGDPGLVVPTRRADGSRQEALGLYGIMDFNLPQWSKEALGRVVSKQEFLSNPDIQTAIYDYKMGQYIHRYGVENAGRAWLGGEGSLNAPMRSDPFGTRVGDYGRHFAELVKGNGNAQTMGSFGSPLSTNIEDSRRPGPMGSSPQVPFPGATDSNNFARRMTSSPWMALVNAGAQMAQTHGPIGSVIGAGIQAGSRTLEGQRQELDNEELINQKAQALHMAAEQHLRAYAQKDQEIAETKRWHDTVANLRGTGQFASTLAKVQANPMYAGLSEEQQEVEAAKILSQGSARAPGAPQGAPEKPPGVPDNAQYSQKSGSWWTPDGKEWGKTEKAG